MPAASTIALYDQVVVDRAFGGRFVNKEGKAGLARMGGDFKIWDALTDLYPGEPHQAFKPGTAAAANPVCMSCKSADHILDWAYQQHYKDLAFGDFKHGITGAMRWKGRHADAKTFYNSTHQKRGIECSACHMPKVTDPKTGKSFTSHWQTSPRHSSRKPASPATRPGLSSRPSTPSTRSRTSGPARCARPSSG